MKILLVNTYGHAGAASSCIRLHKSLLNEGIESTLLLLKDTAPKDLASKIEFAEKENLKELTPSDNLLQKIYKKFFVTDEQKKQNILSQVPNKLEWFSFADTGIEIQNHPAFKEADIINFHWVSGFIDYSIFEKIKKPVIWTLHDMNPFTGGCHYSGTCFEYKNKCYQCIQLKDSIDERFSSSIFNYKKNYLNKFQNLTIVSPSQWLSNCSRSSALFSRFHHQTIPYGLDSKVFSPKEKIEMRKKYNLPVDKTIMLFVSYQSLYVRRKGYSILLEAISKIKNDSLCLLSVGGSSGNINSNVPIIDYGFVDNENTMSELYSAADFFVIPSLEDNLPNTVIEALLCGIPVTGFPAGGIPEMIKTGFNGLIAEGMTVDALYDSIIHMAENIHTFNNNEIRKDAYERFDQKIQGKRYIDLFTSVLEKTNQEK